MAARDSMPINIPFSILLLFISFFTPGKLILPKASLPAFFRDKDNHDGDKAKIQYYLRVPPDGRTQEVEVLPIEPFGGPFGTVPELLFERKQLIPILQQMILEGHISAHNI
ncbi:MAG: hypothetical protein WBQ62_06100 [Dehalococcoidales bacterium]